MKMTDETLLRYADGKLDADEQQKVEKFLKTDQLATERLRLMTLSGGALQSLQQDKELPEVSEKIIENLTSTDQQIKQPRKPFWRTYAIAATLAVFFSLVGFSIGSVTNYGSGYTNSNLPQWVERVVDYHSLYARETVEASNLSSEEKSEIKIRLENAINKSVTFPDLKQLGLEFRRAQILKFETEPVIQLVYLPINGKPVALCFKKTNQSDSKPKYTTFRKLGVMRWQADGYDYILVGDIDKDQLEKVSQNAIKQFES